MEHQDKRSQVLYGTWPSWQSPNSHLFHPTYSSSIACPSANEAFPRSQTQGLLLPLLPRKSDTFLPKSQL